jgi:hypothetical protein
MVSFLAANSEFSGDIAAVLVKVIPRFLQFFVQVIIV